MENNSKEKKINKKKIHNYIILIVIFILFILVVLYLSKWYSVYDEYQRETPVIRGNLQEIVSDDLEHYVMDNPSSLVYICTANEDICREFEKDFKKLIVSKAWGDKIVYLNVTSINQENFIKEFNEKYSKKKKLTSNYPAFVLFEDGKAVNILQGNEQKELTITKARHFLDLNITGE